MIYNKINIGTAPNSGDGDTLREAFEKVNANYEMTYTVEEVNTEIATAIDSVEVDLSNYYDKDEVDAQMNGITLTSVLNNGGTTSGTMKIGPVTYSSDYHPIEMPDGLKPSNPGFQVSMTGEVLASDSYTIDNDQDGTIIFSNNTTGVIRVFNSDGNRRTRVRFTTPTANNEVTFPNKSGTVAMTSDITGISDAPMDGQQYARQAGNWTVVDTSGGSTDPGAQNLALVGTDSYKLLTTTATGVTHGNHSLYFANKTTMTPVTLGARSVSFGTNCSAAGQDSMAGGSNSTINSSLRRNSIAWGNLVTVKHANSFGFGNNVETTTADSMVVGKWNATSGTVTSSLFTVGNGTGNTNRTNALEVLDTGVILAPNLSLSEIDEASAKALVTKEWTFDNMTDPDVMITALTNASPEQLDNIKNLLGIS